MPQCIRSAIEQWFNTESAKECDIDRSVLLELAETLFYASLATEEKEPTRVALAWHLSGAGGLRNVFEGDGRSLPTVLAWDVLRFKERPFNVANVAKTAPIAESGRSVLVIGGSPNALVIDGVARRRPQSYGQYLVLISDSPGVITIANRGRELFRYERGESVQLTPYIFGYQGPVHSVVKALAAPLGLELAFSLWNKPTDIMEDLAAAMHRTKHGGLLLFMPQAPAPDEDSRLKLKVLDTEILQRPLQKVEERATSLFNLFLDREKAKDALAQNDETMLGAAVAAAMFACMINPAQEDASVRAAPTEEDESVRLRRELQAAKMELTQWVNTVGRLTAVDNAVLIGPGFRVLGAQYEVTSENSPQVFEARDWKGVDVRPYEKLHGSRHRAAASFVSKGDGRFSILSSADGPLRCFLSVNGRVVMWHVRLLDI